MSDHGIYVYEEADGRFVACADAGGIVAWFVRRDDADLFAAALRWSRCAGPDGCEHEPADPEEGA